MPTLNVDFEAFCGKCGAGICDSVEVGGRNRKDYQLNIEPCQTCLDSSHNDGFEEGKKEAWIDRNEANAPPTPKELAA